MKISQLSLAIVTAISLAACGGSSGSDMTTTDDSNQKIQQLSDKLNTLEKQNNDLKNKNEELNKKLEGEKDDLKDDKEIADKDIDPSQSGVVGGLDPSKSSSQGSTQFRRMPKSEFMRVLNKEEDPSRSAIAVLGVNLNEQNPYLSNIIPAKEPVKGSKEVLIQYLGISPQNDVSKTTAQVNADGTLGYEDNLDKWSLQYQNYANVKLADAEITDHLNSKAYKQKIAGYIDTLNALNEAVKERAGNEAADADKAKWNSLSSSIETKIRYLKENTETDDIDVLYRKSMSDDVGGLGIALADWERSKDDPKAIFQYFSTADATKRAFGDTVSTKPAVRGDWKGKVAPAGAEAGYDTAADLLNAKGDASGNPHALGLVAYGYNDRSSGQEAEIWGTEEQSRSSTRVFGKNYDVRAQEDNQNRITHGYEMADGSFATVDPSYYNSYLPPVVYAKGGQEVVDSKKGDLDKLLADPSLKTAGGLPDTDVSNALNAAVTNTKTSVTYDMAVMGQRLHDVQYGRVTGDLNYVGFKNADAHDDSGHYFKRKSYMDKEDTASVDTYFYRGTNATTIAQMNALPKNTTIRYLGHALMYGIDNSYHLLDNKDVPNAFGGVARKKGIGNFVQANLTISDKEKSKLEGTVFNVWQNGSTSSLEKQDLVTFRGTVKGNSAFGEAKKTYDEKAPRADFVASFFGKEAQELGGSFSSVRAKDKPFEHDNGQLWGGVFGAKRIYGKTAPVAPSKPTGGDVYWAGDFAGYGDNPSMKDGAPSTDKP